MQHGATHGLRFTDLLTFCKHFAVVPGLLSIKGLLEIFMHTVGHGVFDDQLRGCCLCMLLFCLLLTPVHPRPSSSCSTMAPDSITVEQLSDVFALMAVQYDPELVHAVSCIHTVAHNSSSPSPPSPRSQAARLTAQRLVYSRAAASTESSSWTPLEHMQALLSILDTSEGRQEHQRHHHRGSSRIP